MLARRAAWAEGNCRRPRLRTVDTSVANPATDRKPHLWFPVILRFRGLRDFPLWRQASCASERAGVDSGWTSNTGDITMATARKPAATPRTDTRSPTPRPQAAQPLPSEKIAERAYQIWQASGRPSGRDKDHWFQAELELRSGAASRS